MQKFIHVLSELFAVRITVEIKEATFYMGWGTATIIMGLIGWAIWSIV
jgi:hypothetical protein